MGARVSSWLAAHDPVGRVRLSRRSAVGLTLVVYAGIFGPGVYEAIVLSRGGDQGGDAGIDLTGTVVALTCDALVALVAGLAVIRGLVGSWRPVTGAGVTTWRREIVAGSLCTVLATGSSLLMPLLPTRSYPFDTSGAGQLTDFVGFIRTGPVEEICALLAPLIILRAGRVSWPVVFALLVAIRLSYHVYYGPGVVFMALWAFGTVIVYLWARSIIGIAIAHSLLDLTGLPVDFGHVGIAVLLRVPFVLACLGVSIRALWLLRRRRRTALQDAAFPAPVLPPPPAD